MGDWSEYDAAMNRFWRFQTDLFAFQGMARTNSLTRQVVVDARLAWVELRRLQDDLRCSRADDREHLQKIADPFRRLLGSLSLASGVPLLSLVEGDPSAWDRLADRLATEPPVPKVHESPRAPSLTEAQQILLIALWEADRPLKEPELARLAFGPAVLRCRDHLRALVQLGLVESGGPGRNSPGYRLTEPGQKFAEELTRQFDGN